jgi:opacity protein-like surface antigen
MMIGNRLRLWAATTTMWLAAAGAALAQAAPPAAPPNRGYVEVVAQSAFGTVTSQSFGGEVGVAIRPNVQVFVEGGRIRDAAPSTLGARAQTIAAGIAAVAGTADFRVRQPVTFGLAGLKYVVTVSGTKAEPYVLVGGGFANVKRDVSFTTSAGDASQFVTLGSDLSGSETKGMVSVGAGFAIPLWRTLGIDLQYRYGRVFTSNEGLNVSRAGIGVGVRF